MASQIEYKFFEAVEKSFDKAAVHTSWDKGRGAHVHPETPQFSQEKTDDFELF